MQRGSPSSAVSDPASAAIASAHQKLTQAERLRRSGDLEKAVSICEALIDQYPDYVGALHTLGLIHIRTEKYWQALSCFVRAAMLNPKDWTILTSLAQVYLSLGAAELSAKTLEQAIAINQTDANIHFTLGQIYDHEREYELAAKSFEKAVTLDSSHAPAWSELGKVYIHMGLVEEAAEALTSAHKANPAVVYALSSLSQLPPHLTDISILTAIDEVDRKTSPKDDDFVIRTAFARAEALDRLGRYEEAWEQLVAANKPLHQRYGAAYRKHVQTRKAATSRAETYRPKESGWPSKSDYPISLFILGPSRSGKTTLEKLIGNMRGVKRGYESPIVERAVKRTSQLSGLLTLSLLSGLPKTLDSRFAELYCDELMHRASGAAVFTNTHPGRIADVGRIADTVPNARFVFVRRDTDDTALRILMKHYRKDTNYYGYDVPATYGEIAWYYQLIDIYGEKLASICTQISYEDLIAEPLNELASVANLCGLETFDGLVTPPGDDRGCAGPYKKMLASARVLADNP